MNLSNLTSKLFFGIGLFIFILTPAHFSMAASELESRLEVSLYTGIPTIGHLGQSYKELTENTKVPFVALDVAADEDLMKAGIVYGIFFESLGTKIYFKRSGSSLIVIQPPFKGLIKTTQILLFDMQKADNKTWDDVLVKELGPPATQGSVGILGGNLFFYNWGDVEVSRIGLRQLMLYRDRSISEYRQTTKTGATKLFK